MGWALFTGDLFLIFVVVTATVPVMWQEKSNGDEERDGFLKWGEQTQRMKIFLCFSINWIQYYDGFH